MNGHLIDMAVAATTLKELGDPIEAVWGRGSARASKGVTLAGEREEMSTPSGDSVGNGCVGLGRFIDSRMREKHE